MAETSMGNTKLIQYLTEAYGKERELETSLTAHIGMATRPAYKKRLQQHLKETKQHAKLVERRLKKLGGRGMVAELAALPSRGVALAKGPLHGIRGTGEEEKQLKNAKTEYSEEHEEIATYLAIEVLAQSVGDTETAKLAKQIRREEERMASFLEKQITALTKDVAKAEIPAAERRAGSTRKRSSSRRKSTSAKPAASKATTKRSGGSKAKSSSSRAKPAAKRSSSSKAKSSGSSRKRSTSTRKKS
jgi:ferritin-like metal-binding protein YciE